MGVTDSVSIDHGGVQIAGGSFLMGSDNFYADEGPVHEETVEPFELDEHPVTNDQFARFVADTGYVTVAERPLSAADYPDVPESDLAAGSLVFHGTSGPVDLSDWRAWWTWVPGAQWRHPYGPSSGIGDRGRHPVVQVSFEDARAYAEWAGGRLPTEVEWEYAARAGGSASWPYAWGEDARPKGRVMANTWQGCFPYMNTGADGWRGTSTVGSFPANPWGLLDLIGNVWEWTSTYYAPRHDVPAARLLSLIDDHVLPGDRAADAEHPCACSPSEGARQHGAEGARQHGDLERAKRSAEPGSPIPRRTLKGGSHLCAPEYCLRYRPAARSPQAEDSAATHIGFRCARSL